MEENYYSDQVQSITATQVQIKTLSIMSYGWGLNPVHACVSEVEGGRIMQQWAPKFFMSTWSCIKGQNILTKSS